MRIVSIVLITCAFGFIAAAVTGAFGQRPSTRSQGALKKQIERRPNACCGLQNVQALTELDAQIELHRVHSL